MSKKRIYFLKQKLAGVALLILTAIAIIFVDDGIAVSIFTIPLSAMLIFSKKKIFVNDYYFESKGHKSRKS